MNNSLNTNTWSSISPVAVDAPQIDDIIMNKQEFEQKNPDLYQYLKNKGMQDSDILYPFNANTGVRVKIYTPLSIIPAMQLLDDPDNDSIQGHQDQVRALKETIAANTDPEWLMFSTAGCGMDIFPELKQLLEPIIFDHDTNPKGIAYRSGIGRAFTLEELLENVKKMPNTQVIIGKTQSYETKPETKVPAGKVINIVFKDLSLIDDIQTKRIAAKYITGLRVRSSEVITEMDEATQRIIETLNVPDALKERFMEVGSLSDEDIVEIKRDLNDATRRIIDLLMMEFMAKEVQLFRGLNRVERYLTFKLYKDQVYILDDSIEMLMGRETSMKREEKSYNYNQNYEYEEEHSKLQDEYENQVRKAARSRSMTFKEKSDAIEKAGQNLREAQDELRKKHSELTIQKLEQEVPGLAIFDIVKRTIEYLKKDVQRQPDVEKLVNFLKLFEEVHNNTNEHTPDELKEMHSSMVTANNVEKLVVDTQHLMITELTAKAHKLSLYLEVMHSNAIENPDVREAIVLDVSYNFHKLFSNFNEYQTLKDQVIKEIQEKTLFADVIKAFHEEKSAAEENSAISCITTDEPPSRITPNSLELKENETQREAAQNNINPSASSSVTNKQSR